MVGICVCVVGVGVYVGKVKYQKFFGGEIGRKVVISLIYVGSDLFGSLSNIMLMKHNVSLYQYNIIKSI